MATVFTLAEPARIRIIRMTNVHFDADEEVIKDFFAGLAIEDQVRAVNTRTGTKSVVYVLFATVANCIRSQSMTSSHVLDREIKIQPAQKGNFELNEGQTGFVRPQPGGSSATPKAIGIAPPNFGAGDFPPLRPEDVKATLSTSAGQDHCNDTTGTDAEDPVESLNANVPNFTPSPDKTWNLNSHDANDRTHNVITPDDWYGFEAKMCAKVEQEQKERGTNYRDIIDKAGRYEEPAENEQGNE